MIESLQEQKKGKTEILRIFLMILLAVILSICIIAIFLRSAICELFSIISHQTIAYSQSVDKILVYVVIITAIVLLLEYVFISLPKMCTGIYRLDDNHMQIRESVLGLTLVDMYIPLASITNVKYKRDISRWLVFPYKMIEIEVNEVTYDIHCLAHQKELFEKLQDFISNKKV